MAIKTDGFIRRFLLFVLVSAVLVCSVWNQPSLKAQLQGAQASSTLPQYTTVVAGTIPFSASTKTKPEVSKSGAGLTIIPTFDTGSGTAIDAPTQTVINNAIAFYESTFTTNITVHIYFYNMTTGLGQSTFFVFGLPYQTYCTALAGSATSPDDTTAIANTPCGANNPVTMSSNITLKIPTGLALQFGPPEPTFSNGPPCPNFTGSGCIGLNVTLANSHSILLSTVEHEMDEVLGLGSGLSGTTTPTDPWPEDLFRWASAGKRGFAANAGISGNPTCPMGTPAAFFSIDGGQTDLDDFNNCNNGGDYGDWTTHTPSQVQDAFTNASASPSLTITSPEIRALDVIGLTIVTTSTAKHRRGQIISQ